MLIRFANADDERLASLAPEHWRRKAAAMRFEKDRRLELVAGGLLVDMLAQRLSAMDARRDGTSDTCSPAGSTRGGHAPFHDLRIAELPGGKPYLVDYPGIHFSLSHSETVAMCAMGGRPLGCDVEKIVPLDDDTRKAIGSIEEWTLAEAKFKCGPDAGAPRHVPAPVGYSAALAERTDA